LAVTAILIVGACIPRFFRRFAEPSEFRGV